MQGHSSCDEPRTRPSVYEELAAQQVLPIPLRQLSLMQDRQEQQKRIIIPGTLCAICFCYMASTELLLCTKSAPCCIVHGIHLFVSDLLQSRGEEKTEGGKLHEFSIYLAYPLQQGET